MTLSVADHDVDLSRPLAGLLRAVETWTLDDRGERLTWRSGAYGELDAFRAASVDESFACGEGLPGAAWETRGPVVMHHLSAGVFKRAAAAREAGLAAGIALPCFRGDQLQGVVVFLCDDGANAQGAFEVWSRNHREELGLTDSYYANLERFGVISQHVKFPRGSGLPGETWESHFPLLVSNLGRSKAFMRAAGAKADGLATGLGVPVMRTALELDSVVVLLSSARTPLARAIEVWGRDAEQDELRICQADYGSLSELADASRSLRCASGEGLAGRAWQSGAPEATESAEEFESARAHLLVQHGLTTAVSVPAYVGSEMTSVVVMYL